MTIPSQIAAIHPCFRLWTGRGAITPKTATVSDASTARDGNGKGNLSIVMRSLYPCHGFCPQASSEGVKNDGGTYTSTRYSRRLVSGSMPGSTSIK